MPTGLERREPESGVHFVTVSCFRRKPLLGTTALRDLFQAILFETRDRYRFELKAYVIMPEHVHLIARLSKDATLATILQVLKQRYSVAMKKRALPLYRAIEQQTAHPPPMPVWETRYYDFNLHDPETMQRKIGYIHQNPVKRGLVNHARDWPWSSYREHETVYTYQI